MNRKLLYAGLVLVNLMPFIYAFFKGYSFLAPFANLIAFAAGKEYEAWLFLFVLVALLLSIVFVFTSASTTTSGSAKKHVILHPSDGHRITEENQQKVLHLQQLLLATEQEQRIKGKGAIEDVGLDMSTS